MWKKLIRVALIVLAVLFVIFLIMMLLPDGEEEKTDERAKSSFAEQLKEAKENGMARIEAEAVDVETGADSATIMIYMNGSDLESQDGEASEDISEMLASGIGERVNVIVQTMGTKTWHEHGISPKTAQTYRVRDGKLSLIRDDLGQLDSTSEETLSEFIGFCASNYPAERYVFLFWDHGGGPVYGFGLDEWQDEEESLTIAEMSRAFSEHPEVKFDMIGMDCCIMASLETCLALEPYCAYTLLSEDFESGIGWSYTQWMKKFDENPGMATPILGKFIVDDIVSTNETDPNGSSTSVGLYNVSTAQKLFSAWKAFAYRNESALLETNYSREHQARGRGWDFWDLWEEDDSQVTLSDYYISDILALTESVDKNSDEAKELKSALKAAVAYFGHTSDKNELTGLAVSLPYGDPEFYDQLKDVYTEIGLDRDYIEWLAKFASEGSDDYYDFEDFESDWGGWGSYESEYGGNYCDGEPGEYGFDYGEEGDWVYDYEEEIWYLIEDDELYLYDDETNTLFFYDEEEDEIYYYDEQDDEWYLTE